MLPAINYLMSIMTFSQYVLLLKMYPSKYIFPGTSYKIVLESKIKAHEVNRMLASRLPLVTLNLLLLTPSPETILTKRKPLPEALVSIVLSHCSKGTS